MSETPNKTLGEVSRNFAPTLPKDLGKAALTVEQKGNFLSPAITKAKDIYKKIGDKALGPLEGSVPSVTNQTAELYNLLVKRVELRMDISRLAKKGIKLGANAKEPSLQQKIDMIKKGGVRNVVVKVDGGGNQVNTRTLGGDLKDLRETEGKISDLLKVHGVAEQYTKFREARVEKLRSAKETSDGAEAIKQLNLQQERMAREAYLEGRQYSPGEQRIVEENRQIVGAIKDRISELKKDPEVFDLSRLRELETYQRGLKKKDRFAETPSREAYIDQVRQYWARGKKVLLTGPTGGGKTELLLHASRSLFGQEAERVTGHELMTNYEIYGKMKGGVNKEGQMTLMFGSAGYSRALEKDVPFIFDEINVVPNKLLMRIKTDLNAGPGQRVTIQEDGDKVIIVGPHFAVGATENVKSEKHAEREKLDPALVRMFESMAIDYFPPPELYDIMLSSMMDARGGVKLSIKDATESLKALCDATGWVQQAYLGQRIAIGPNQFLEARGQAAVGKSATLREAVLDPGKALDMLVGWEDAQKAGLTFREFLNKRIVAFVNNENFPEEDRYYLTEIFALQGFLRDVDVNQLRVSGLEQKTLDAWSGYDKKRYVSKNNYIPPEIVAKLDPYVRLSRPVSVAAGDLLDQGETIQEVQEDDAKLTLRSPQSSSQLNIPRSLIPSPLSIEGKRKLATLDMLYPPTNLPSESDYEKRFFKYPAELMEIAKSDPSTHMEIANRLSKIIEGTDPYYADVIAFVNTLDAFTKLTLSNKQIRPIIASMLNRIDSMQKWKSNQSSVGDINDALGTIEKMLVS